MPSLGSGLSLGTLNKISGFDFDASAFITQAGIASEATIPLYGKNLLPSSNNFADTNTWQQSLCSITPNATSNPFGTANDAFLFSNINVSYGNILRMDNFRVSQFLSNNTRYMVSVYAKANASNFIGIRLAEIANNGGNNYSFADLSNGTTTLLSPVNGVNHSLTATLVGNGWYRVEYSFTNNTSTVAVLDFCCCNSTGQSGTISPAGTRSVYIWGAQLEITSNTTASAYAETASNNPNLVQEAQLRTSGTLLSEVINPRRLINDFVVGVKSFGLFNSLVCWPTRSFLNASSGNTMYSLGGLGQYNGTFAGTTPTRRLSGLQATSTNSYLQTTYSFNLTSNFSSICVGNLVEGGNKRIIGSNGPTHLLGATTTTSGAYGLYDHNGVGSYTYGSAPFSFSTYKPMYYTISKTGSVFTQYQYGSTTPDVATINGLNNVSNNIAYFGSNGTSDGGIYPFLCMINNINLSSAQSSNFYALYKSTLGYGTSLP